MGLKIAEHLVELKLRGITNQVMSNSKVSFDRKDIETLNLELFFPFSHRLDSEYFLFREIEFHDTDGLHCSVKF